MQKVLDDTRNELKVRIKKYQNELKDSLEKKIDNVEENINSVEEKIALKLEEKIARMEDLEKKLLAGGNENKSKSVHVSAFPEPVHASPVPVPASPVSVKLSIYDGKTNWELYKTQFCIILEVNGWNEGVTACQPAASLTDGLKEEDIQKAVRTADVQDLQSALLYALKLKAATQASRKHRHFIRGAKEYVIEIRYRKGSAHGNSDAFSRRHCPESCKYCSRIEKKFGVKDPEVRQITAPSTLALDPWSDDSVRKDQLAVPEIKSIVEFKSDVEKCCRICDPCAARKGSRKRTRGRLQLYNVGAPFERIAFDILGPVPRSSDGNNNILVVLDSFTKWPETYPIPDQEA
ncbi:transposon Ty3-I Gag-Pol polyprotein [Trichonephila clavipes]|uniref:Transposon Ty3-I Gag-Pol polyprotein n=1 Tax=Trichonephila clavipes TaxID=2585209 RepID=A0A8X6S6C1_TRICX|nr:transposon Ty3-I Gag-Pol polyprotein [Trichonephila clavipes]